MVVFQDRQERVETELAAATALLRIRWERAVRRLRSELTEDVLERLIADGRLAPVLRSRIEDAARALAAAQQEALIGSGRGLLAELSRQSGRPSPGLDLSSSTLSRTMRSERDRILSYLVVSLLGSSLSAQSRAASRGAGLTGQARAVRSSLGLTAPQTIALERYRELLERTSSEALRRELRDEERDEVLEEAIEEGEPLSSADVERMSDAYRRNSLALAALSLAQFEAQQSTNLGAQEALDQAADAGAIEPVTWTWRTARDERVRPSHRAMHGQERRDGEPFRSGDGNSLRYPGDPLAPASDTRRCRCVRTARAGVVAPVGVA